MRSIFLAAVLLAGGALPVAAAAEPLGTFVPAPQAFLDFVVDDSRKLVYIYDNGTVIRWDTVTQAERLPAIVTGAVEGGGIDISPDSSRIVVADGGSFYSYPDKIRVRVINLDTLQATVFETAAQYPEQGTYGVAFASNDIVYVTGTFAGSAMSTNLYKLDLRAGAWTRVGYAPFRSWINRSPDYSKLYFSGADDGASDTYIMRIDTATGLARTLAVDRGMMEAFGHDSAGRFVVGGFGAFVFDADFNEIAWPDDYAPPAHPYGPGAISPVEDLLYLSTSDGPVNAYDMATGETLGSYDLGQATYYRSGRIRFSRDGSLMVVSVYRGVRVVRLYEPLTAGNMAVYTTEGRVRTMVLPGSIGIDAPLAFAIDRPPLHGKVSLSGATAMYKPNPGYRGGDGFGYTVTLKGATTKGWVNVMVYPGGRMHIYAKGAAGRPGGKRLPTHVRGTRPHPTPAGVRP